MRLLFVHQKLGEFGGAEGSVEMTARGLHDLGHSASLVYIEGTGRKEEEWRQIFTACFCLPETVDSKWLHALLAQVGPDIIFLHNLSHLDWLELLINSGVPVIRMVHDHAMYCMRTYKYNYFTRNICTRPVSAHCVFPCLASIVRDDASRFGLKWASLGQKRREIRLNQQCAAILVYSNYQKQELMRNGFDADKIQVFTPLRTVRGEAGTSSFSYRNLILFAGQIVRGKGVDALLHALAQVTVDFDCVVLGEGNHRGHCEKLCRRLGLGERVTFQGYVLPQELQRYYLEASVFVMSSLWPEPFGMAGPEAMRAGLPVVAFDAGAIGEWLQDGENGFLVPWGDTAMFAKRVQQLLCDKALARKLGERGRESVQRWDAGRHIAAMEKLLERVCRAASFTTPGCRAPAQLSPIAI